MKEYKIKMMDHAPMCDKCWSRVEKTMIDECVWMDDYKPVCYAQVCYVKGDGFWARLTCEESNPKAVHEGFFSDVYKDSCLEMFAKWDDASDKYINIEMNSKGSCLIALGADRYDRTPIDKLCGHPFDVKAEVKDKEWNVTVHVTEEDLCKIYGMSADKFVPGYVIMGNFYKCGDETDVEHYVMWNPVGTEKPDYHRPEFFGRMVIEA